MRSNILGRDPSRFRNLCTGLCAALSLLGMASAHAAPFITAYETTGSAVIAGTSYDFTATLDLKNDYIAGTPLLDSNFNSFNLVVSTVGSEVELSFPVATLNGSIDPSSTVDTSFSVTTLPGNDFFDQNGVEYLVVPAPPSSSTCPPLCILHGTNSNIPTLRNGNPPDNIPPYFGIPAYMVSAASTSVSEPSTLLLLLGGLGAIVFLRGRWFRRLLAWPSTTAF